VLGGIADFAAVAQREFVHKVYITVAHDNKIFLEMLEQARELGVGVRVVPQGFEFIAQDFEKYNIGVIPVLAYSDMRSLYRQRGKRFFDVCASFLLILFLSPVLLLIALAIKFDSKGPVFYRSKRYGRRGQIFHMLKFRSMVADADAQLAMLKAKNEVDGPIFKMRADPRITPLGALLRKFSLDELPQIINVLLGDMSLVGPRPLPIEQIEKEDFRQLKRLDIRPGITGLWQIRGRSDVSFARFLRWDIWYINNWTFGLDIYILMQTIPVVLKGRGAY
jgi:exopolysaccharide biosynthesis polyprenyl glycosylphosphotransferase